MTETTKKTVTTIRAVIENHQTHQTQLETPHTCPLLEKTIPAHYPRSLNIDSASLRSDSTESLESSQIQNAFHFQDDKACESVNNSALSPSATDASANGDSASGNRVNANGSLSHWRNQDLITSRLQPDHSTSLKEEGDEEDEEAERKFSILGDEDSYSVASADENKEFFMPGDLLTPIRGYETMEARPKFTVYKIHVQKTRSDLQPTSWFVFRRYSDFVHLNDKLKQLFPAFQLALPPKRWFRDNFDKEFLDSRRLGLQLFLDNIISHRDICNSEPVRDFFCTDDPPGPHDSLEESRALCDMLEESVYSLRQELQGKDSEIDLLKEELGLYRSRVELLSKQLRLVSGQKLRGLSVTASCSGDDLDEDQLDPSLHHKAPGQDEIRD